MRYRASYGYWLVGGSCDGECVLPVQAHQECVQDVECRMGWGVRGECGEEGAPTPWIYFQNLDAAAFELGDVHFVIDNSTCRVQGVP